MTLELSYVQAAGWIITGLLIAVTHYFRPRKPLDKLVAYTIGLSCILAGMMFQAWAGENHFTVQQFFVYCAVAGSVTILVNGYDRSRSAETNASVPQIDDGD